MVLTPGNRLSLTVVWGPRRVCRPTDGLQESVSQVGASAAIARQHSIGSSGGGNDRRASLDGRPGSDAAAAAPQAGPDGSRALPGGGTRGAGAAAAAAAISAARAGRIEFRNGRWYLFNPEHGERTGPLLGTAEGAAGLFEGTH